MHQRENISRFETLSHLVDFSNALGLEMRTMLSILDWNSIQQAEIEGLRKETERYQHYSKAKGDTREKIKKMGGACFDHWKRELVSRVVEQKISQGIGDPDKNEEMDEDDIDQTIDLFEEMLNFDENISDIGEESDADE